MRNQRIKQDGSRKQKKMKGDGKRHKRLDEQLKLKTGKDRKI